MEQSTKKLLEGLPSFLEASEVGEYISNTCIFARVHIGRCRGTLALPPRAVGVREDRMTEEAKAAYKSIVTLGTLNFIPKEDENALCAIESALRRRLNDCTTTDGLMPASHYSAFAADFEESKRKYMAQRDAILDKWDTIVDQFCGQVKTMLDGVRMLKRDRAKLYKAITECLPSKQRYADSFWMTLYVRAFPTAPSNNPNLPKDVNDAINTGWVESVVDTAEKSVLSLLDEAFVLSNEAVSGFLSKGTIHGRRVNSLVHLGHRLGRMNIFQNPMVNEISDMLKGLQPADADKNEAVLEDCIKKIYCYTYEAGFEPDMKNAAFDAETFESFISGATSVA